MGERYPHRTCQAGAQAEREHITEAKRGGEAIEIIAGDGGCGFLWSASLFFLLQEFGMMWIAVSWREQAEVPAGEDAGERGTLLRMANRFPPGSDRPLRHIGDEGLRLFFTGAFERSEIGLGPSRIVAADAIDDVGRQCSEDGRVERGCEPRGQRRVSRLG